jgi:hypothetical protein
MRWLLTSNCGKITKEEVKIKGFPPKREDPEPEEVNT